MDVDCFAWTELHDSSRGVVFAYRTCFVGQILELNQTNSQQN